MASLTGLFRRGGSFYLKVVLPDTHRVHSRWRHCTWRTDHMSALEPQDNDRGATKEPMRSSSARATVRPT
jgi:hypothetical protein